MKAEDIRENQLVYFRWKYRTYRGVVREVVQDRVAVTHIARIEHTQIIREPKTPSVLILTADQVSLVPWQVQ